MREISAQAIEETTKQLFMQACIRPVSTMDEQLKTAEQQETLPHAKEILRQLQQNNQLAAEQQIPACQDTGLAVVWIEIGQQVQITGGYVEDAIQNGVREAYREGHFRKSVLHPLTRQNTQDNTPAIIHTRMVPGSQLTLTAMPKGFGSENMSKLAMLTPSDGVDGIVEFAVQAAKEAGGNPCPPVVLGVGVGGTFESCALLAKQQLLRPLSQPAEDATIALLEQQIMDAVNQLGIGPMGMGGNKYCLAVHMAQQPTHMAGLPVAINFCCHMLRHATAVL